MTKEMRGVGDTIYNLFPRASRCCLEDGAVAPLVFTFYHPAVFRGKGEKDGEAA